MTYEGSGIQSFNFEASSASSNQGRILYSVFCVYSVTLKNIFCKAAQRASLSHAVLFYEKWANFVAFFMDPESFRQLRLILTGCANNQAMGATGIS